MLNQELNTGYLVENTNIELGVIWLSTYPRNDGPRVGPGRWLRETLVRKEDPVS